MNKLKERIEDNNNVINKGEAFSNEINRNNNIGKKIIICIIILIIIFSAFFVIFILKPNWNYIILKKLQITKIEIDNYIVAENKATITINTEEALKNSEIKCYLSVDDTVSADDEFAVITDNECKFNTEVKDYYVILTNKNNEIINTKKITDYTSKILYIEVAFDKEYLAIRGTKDIQISLTSIGKISNDIMWTSDNSDVATVDNGKVTGISAGTTNIIVSDSYGNSNIVNVIVTDLIDNYVLSEKKPLLKGEVYSLEEANLLDEILMSRVNEAGYATRAGAVAAGRFLTLEFPYGIPYFFENGRLNSSGSAYVDGEGRYYHKGLYLHKSKMESIQASCAGPAIWGMPLMNYENEGIYVSGTRMPNGLDCSGFVSWALLNGGFDPGDYGAGENEEIPNQMTDLGEFVPITKELIESNTVRAGDLINFWGHIGMIIGIDDENYYVAETLPTFKKLIAKTYPKKGLLAPFSYIVLMDSYYKEDGNYTAMWN